MKISLLRAVAILAFGPPCLVWLPAIGAAQNVDLVTLPGRDTVQLTIYNSEDLTLVKERRAVTLRKGPNKLQFSWAGTLIDPTSVELRALEKADQIEVADTVYPGQKQQHLIWNIESEFEGQALVEVSYFTSGLTWQMDYVAKATPDESKLDFNGFVRVFNNSGEEYENAEIRLIVGKINLVEKIADLARRKGEDPPRPQSVRFAQARRRLARESFSLAEKLGDKEDAQKEGKRVVKEGVSEYFMFSVEGAETIANGWSKRMPAVNAADVEFDIVYRMRSFQYGARPVRFFTFRNDEKHALGESPLPNGLIRLFRKNGQDGLSYLGQQTLQYVPIQAEIEVNLGVDDLVVYEARKTGTSRNNFRFKTNNTVIGWDEHQSWVHSVRNYHDKPIVFELRLLFNGDIEVRPEYESTLFDYRTVETKLVAPSRGKADYQFSNTIHHGQNAKQNRVNLKQAP